MLAASAGALANVRVVDLSDRLSGAFCARLMGDLAADVVLVESDDGHPLRREAPFLGDEPGPERSLLHAYANLNKRSALLARDDPRLPRLISQADVAVVSDDATAAWVNESTGESCIVAATTAHGLSGPDASVRGNDLTAYARSGWAWMNGEEGQPPLKGIANQVGYLSGVITFIGTVAALLERQKSTQGQRVDVSELEALTLTAGPSLLSPAYEGRSSSRALPDVFGGPVPARDGYVSVTFSRAHFWRDAMNALGLEHLAEDPKYIDSGTRRQYRSELAAPIEAKLSERDRWDVFEQLGTLRCVCGVLLDMSDLDSNPHLNERGVFVQTEVEGETVRMPGAPFKMSVTPWALTRQAPRLGAHTDEVLGEWLGGNE